MRYVHDFGGGDFGGAERILVLVQRENDLARVLCPVSTI